MIKRILLKSVTAICLVLGLQSVWAAGTVGGGGGDGLDSDVPAAMPMAAPVPLPTGKVLNYSQLKQLWDAGNPTSEALLTGNWIWVASAVKPGCSFNGPNLYDIRGIKRWTGLIPTLIFNQELVPGNSFSGATDHNVFTVRILNFANRGNNQGPYQVDPGEPQFSSFAYDTNVLLRSYYEYSCRGVGGQPDRIFCAITLHLNPSDRTTANPVVRDCAASGIGQMVGFLKITPLAQ